MKSLVVFGITLGIALVVSIISLLFWRVLWVTNVENYELGFAFDGVTGKIERIEKNGWVVRTPIRFSVHKIDLRPYQITITANRRVLNAKLVRFDPNGLETFVEWHGRNAGDETSKMLEILKSYAFDPVGGKDCPFLDVIQEITPAQTVQK